MSARIRQAFRAPPRGFGWAAGAEATEMQVRLKLFGVKVESFGRAEKVCVFEHCVDCP